MLCVGLGTAVVAQKVSDGEKVRNMLSGVDGSIVAVRMGDWAGARASLSTARTVYENIQPSVENVDNELNLRISQSFELLIDNGMLENVEISKGEKEDQLRSLRADLIAAASAVGIHLPFHLQYAMFIILGASVLLALVVVLLVRRSIDLPKMRELKAELSALGKEMRDAYAKRDVKRLHKIQPRYRQLSGQMMGFTLRQMIVTIPPYFLMWWLLGQVFAGWVVAWLPFGIDLPFFGYWTSCGFLSWLIITYFGSSMILRRLLLVGV
jgi:uncharacterized membrane protein (DUF106 family)